MKKIVLSTFASFLLLISGCGGGSSGEPSPVSSSRSSSSSSLSSSEASSSSMPVPPAPNLLAIAESGRITLSWSSAVGAQSYDLYFATEFGITPDNYASLAGGDARLDVISPYQLTGLENGTTYYLVLVVKYQGGESLASGEVRAMPVVPSVIPTGLLNDTGVSWCADASTNNLACPVAGFPGQDGDHGRDAQARAGTLAKVGGGAAGFDFTKLDDMSNDLPASATEWHCVRDNHTGLIWEVKTNDGGLRDWNHTYTWYNPNAATNGGNAGVQNGGICNGSSCDTHAFASEVNVQGLCGANDWRLPTRHELIGIVYADVFHPVIDTDYFPYTRSCWFWSSSPNADAYHNIFAWAVGFFDGHTVGANKSISSCARLVRSGQ